MSSRQECPKIDGNVTTEKLTALPRHPVRLRGKSPDKKQKKRQIEIKLKKTGKRGWDELTPMAERDIIR